MKQSVRVSTTVFKAPLLGPEDCALFLDELRRMPNSYWYPRKTLQPGRGMPGADCDYGWTTKANMPPHVSKLMQQYAPRSPGLELDDWVINRYLPGQYIGPHRDREPYYWNMVVPLQAMGDGVIIDGQFYADEAGVATVFEYATPVHEVPPVKHERFVLIYLLNEK